MKRAHTLLTGVAGVAAAFGMSVAGATSIGVAGLNHAATSTPFATTVAAEVGIVEGVIEKVDLNAKEFVVAIKEEGLREDTRKKVTFKTNDQTVFTLDGMSSTMGEALKTGRETVVTHEENVAARVDVWSAPEN